MSIELAPAADVVRRAQDAYEDATGFADYRNGEKGMRAALAVAYPTLTAQVAALTAQRKDAERPLGKPSDYTFGPLETLEEIRATLKHCERHCPCGARPESLRTHPHVIGCPVPKTLRTVDTAIDSAIAAGNGEGMA